MRLIWKKKTNLIPINSLFYIFFSDSLTKKIKISYTDFIYKKIFFFMTMMNPSVIKVLEERGEINDELDYALMNYLLQNRGVGFTACQPQLVEIEGGKKAIKMDIDHTFVDKNNQLMGLGIVGNIYVEIDSLQVIYCTPLEELAKNIDKLKAAGINPQPRPKGKY